MIPKARAELLCRVGEGRDFFLALDFIMSRVGPHNSGADGNVTTARLAAAQTQPICPHLMLVATTQTQTAPGNRAGESGTRGLLAWDVLS